LDWAIQLLESICASPEKVSWCRGYDVYTENAGQEEMQRDLDTFIHQAYEFGLVIPNYRHMIELGWVDEEHIAEADKDWLSDLHYASVLACISYHFRRDHFVEGSLIRNSVASGAMLRLLRRLKLVQEWPCIATTLETLYESDCSGIPQEPGVYRIVAPSELTIQFANAAQNSAFPVYPAGQLANKYQFCQDKRTLYIGKANGKGGLQQRIRQYMKYGWNEAVNHKGGRAIWQIRDSAMLLLEYECCVNCEKREHFLLQKFREENGTYPLANWRG
jgi:hypothetical protein